MTLKCLLNNSTCLWVPGNAIKTLAATYMKRLGWSDLGERIYPATCMQRPVCSDLYAATCMQRLVRSDLYAATCMQRLVCSDLYAAVLPSDLAQQFLRRLWWATLRGDLESDYIGDCMERLVWENASTLSVAIGIYSIDCSIISIISHKRNLRKNDTWPELGKLRSKTNMQLATAFSTFPDC